MFKIKLGDLQLKRSARMSKLKIVVRYYFKKITSQ